MPTTTLAATANLGAGVTVTPTVSWPTAIQQATLRLTSADWSGDTRLKIAVETSNDGGLTFISPGSIMIFSGALLDGILPAITVDRQSALLVPGFPRPGTFLPASTAVLVRLRLTLDAPLSLGASVTF